MSVPDLLLVACALSFAGLVKGVTGMGRPLFATPILAGVFGARPAVVIISIPILAANVVLLWQARSGFGILRELCLLTMAGVAGVVVGLVLLVRLDQNLLVLLMAALVVLFLARGDRLLGDDPRARRVRLLGPAVGAISGVLNGSTSIASPLLASYLHALRLEKREFVIALAAVFQIFSLVQVVGLWRLGLYDDTTLPAAILGLAPTLVCTFVGARIRDRLDNARFRTLITILLALSTVNLVAQGLRGLDVLP